MTHTSLDPALDADAHAQIATQVLQVHLDSYGTGAGNVVVHILDDVVVVVIDQLELAPSEKTLIEGGHTESVANMRASFQQAIEPTFTAIVERATGRRVTSFLSNTSIPSLYSVEIFRLAH